MQPALLAEEKGDAITAVVVLVTIAAVSVSLKLARTAFRHFHIVDDAEYPYQDG